MNKFAHVAIVATTVAVADQISKIWIRDSFIHGSYKTIVECCAHIVHVNNTGGAFSLFASAPDQWRVPFFMGATVVAVVALVAMILATPARRRGPLTALAAVLGGAFGNFYDRVTYGHVTDFIDIHYAGYHWPAFNVADAAITCGIVVILWDSFFSGGDETLRPDEWKSKYTDDT